MLLLSITVLSLLTVSLQIDKEENGWGWIIIISKAPFTTNCYCDGFVPKSFDQQMKMFIKSLSKK
jgi:hypothetical protein